MQEGKLRSNENLHAHLFDKYIVSFFWKDDCKMVETSSILRVRKIKCGISQNRKNTQALK